MKEQTGVVNEIAATLQIDPQAVSKRLLFAKTSRFDSVWHIIDAKMFSAESEMFMALHGNEIPANLKADSLIQLSLKEANRILICAGCLREFLTALEQIEANPNTKFEVKGKAGTKYVLSPNEIEK